MNDAQESLAIFIESVVTIFLRERGFLKYRLPLKEIAIWIARPPMMEYREGSKNLFYGPRYYVGRSLDTNESLGASNELFHAVLFA